MRRPKIRPRPELEAGANTNTGAGGTGGPGAEGRDRPGLDLERPGGGGVRHRINRAEQLKRRGTLAKLLESAMPMARCEEVMGQQFAMTRKAVQRLAGHVYDGLAAEENERRPHLKRLQLRRLVGYITAARTAVDAKKQPAPNWGAVAAFERLYAQVAGTLEPVEVHSNVNVDVRESIALVLEQMPSDRLVLMADRARQWRAGAGALLPATKAG